MRKKPELPKRLAARIRGAQEKVRAARIAIKADEFNGRQISSRLDEYDSDPHGFASRHYGRNGVDSYPVQTNISRARERMDYIECRRERRVMDLAEAEANLELVEAAVLSEVLRMKPTSGRVPWPRRLPSFANYMDEVTRELEQCRREHDRYLHEVEADHQAELRAIDMQRDREDAAYLAEVKARRAAMTPAQLERDKAAFKFITEGLRSGAFTALDIINHLRAKTKG
jgi:hypothetical protein